jgi:2-dehydropantoate 2-reductase
VTFIARGANLQAIRRDGIRLQLRDGTEHTAARANRSGESRSVLPPPG